MLFNTLIDILLLLFQLSLLQHIPLKESSVSLIETSAANFKIFQEDTMSHRLEVLPIGSRNITVQAQRRAPSNSYQMYKQEFFKRSEAIM